MDLATIVSTSASREANSISLTTLRLTISPLAFLTFRSFIKKYQNRDFATTVLGANMRIRYSFGVGLASLGRWRPMTWYSVRRPEECLSAVTLSTLPRIAKMLRTAFHCCNEAQTPGFRESAQQYIMPKFLHSKMRIIVGRST